ncbi:MAG: CsbD family protein [Pseudonocardiaceae bacterium]
MSTGDKIRNKAQELGGKGKETVGDATGDPELRAEGQADQTESSIKQAGEKVKDAGAKIKDAFTGK